MLSDPFQTTYEGAYRGGSALGQGITGIADIVSKGMLEKKKKSDSLAMLKQWGIIKDKSLTIDDYKKAAEEQTGGEINISSTLPEAEQLTTAQKLFQAAGLKMPQVKGTEVDLDRATKLGLQYNLGTGETVIKPETLKGRSIADATDLTPQQQLEARVIAKQFGVRNMEYTLPSIYEQMRMGKTRDAIEDSLRYGGQSKEFGGAIRDAAQTLLLKEDKEKTQNAMDIIDDNISKGEMGKAKSKLKLLALGKVGVEESNRITGKERTVELLDKIKDDLNTLEANGINTNILSGTYEEVQGKLGLVANPELRKLITKINTTIFNYRKQMSGVAFPDKETRDYKKIFPGGDKTKELNMANINALKDVFGGDVEYFYKKHIGEENYDEIFGKKEEKSTQISSLPPDKAKRLEELRRKKAEGTLGR